MRMQTMARAHLIISGKVQGVFFRAETQQAARRIGAMGWVRNRPDGTVEAVVEGSREIVDQMIAWCWQGSPYSRVDNVEVDWESFSGEFDQFSIRR